MRLVGRGEHQLPPVENDIIQVRDVRHQQRGLGGLLCGVRRLWNRRARNQICLLLNFLLLLANRILNIKLQTVHLPLSNVERFKEDLVGDVAPTPIRELHDGNIESRIWWKHRFQGVSESRDIVVPGSVQRCVESDRLPVTGREEESR